MVLAVGLLPTVNRLHCDRQSTYYTVCQLRSFSLIGVPSRSITLDPLQGAQPQPDTMTPGYGTRVLLYAQASRRIPFSRYGTTWASSDRTAQRINGFLANPDLENFTVWDLVPSPLLFSVLVGGASISVMGLGLLWVSQAKSPA